MTGKTLFWSAVLGLFLMVSVVGADLVVLQPGPQDGRDTYIGKGDYAIDAGINYGSQSDLYVKDYRRRSEAVSFGLLAFDLPVGLNDAEIHTATLELFVHDGLINGTNPNFYFYQVTSAWEPDQVTWNTQPSYDDSTLSGSFQMPYTVSSTPWMGGSPPYWASVDITQAVGNWADGSWSNYGLVIMAADYFNNSFQAYSSDFTGDAALRPKLTIDYTPIPEPVSAALLVFGTMIVTNRREKHSGR